jgi:hypothetical protein
VIEKCGDKQSEWVLKIKPTWCTIVFSIFIFFSTCFERQCTHHQEKQLYLCDTWYLLFCVDEGVVCIPDSNRHRIISTKCRINTVITLDDGHRVARNMKWKINKHTKKTLCTKLALFSRLYRDTRSTEHKKNEWWRCYIALPSPLLAAVVVACVYGG